MTSGSINFTMLFQVEDSPPCIVFSLFPKRSIGRLDLSNNKKNLVAETEGNTKTVRSILSCRLQSYQPSYKSLSPCI